MSVEDGIFKFMASAALKMKMLLMRLISYYDDSMKSTLVKEEGWQSDRSHFLLTDLWWEHHCIIWGKHRQKKGQRWWHFAARQNKECVRREVGERVESSPGWRVWTVCFGLCVVWPATLRSLHAAMTRPTKKFSVSTDGDPKPGPEAAVAACIIAF